MNDNDMTGFVIFPTKFDRDIKISDSGKTMIYLCAFEEDMKKSTYSNLDLNLEGVICGDNLTSWNSNIEKNDVLSAVKSISDFDIINSIGYTKNGIEIPLISSILIGWSDYTYEYLDRDFPWVPNFRSLTNEGRKLYYAMKKLHNEKDLRLITFNKIK